MEPLAEPSARPNRLKWAIGGVALLLVVSVVSLLLVGGSHRTAAEQVASGRHAGEQTLTEGDTTGAGSQSVQAGAPGSVPAVSKSTSATASATQVGTSQLPSTSTTAPARNTPSTTGSHASPQWPMFMGGAQHTGQASADGPMTARILWNFAPRDLYSTARSAPVIGFDGTVYVSRTDQAPCPDPASGGPNCAGSVVDALRPDGSLLWQWADTSELLLNQPLAVAGDGTVFTTTSFSGKLIAIAPGGHTKWELALPDHYFHGSVTIGPDGRLYLQDSMSTIYAVRPSDGTVVWQMPLSAGEIGVGGSPAFSADGSTIYAGSGAGVLYALDTAGHVLWNTAVSGPTDGNIANSPAVGPDGTIYVATGGRGGSTPGDLDAFTPSGALKWHYTADGGFETTPAVTRDGLVVAGDDSGTVVAVHASDGGLAWTFHSPGDAGSNLFTASAAVGDDGTVYLQNQYGLFALKNGNVLWSGAPGSDASAALSTDGVLYVASNGGLIAYK